jgi:hypothetical protein
LDLAQSESLASILVDDAGIGKTVAAEWHAKNRRYSFHIDCCANPSKPTFVRAVAQALGIGRGGKLGDLIEDVIYTLRQMETPILILDEAGDLEHAAILALKRFYNALKGVCGFYMIGAEGLKKKIKLGVASDKLGFIEVFSRFGRDFKRVTPDVIDEKVRFYRKQATEIALANGLSREEAGAIGKMLIEGSQLKDMRFVETAVKGFLREKKEVA